MLQVVVKLTHNDNVEMATAKQESWKWYDVLTCILTVTPSSVEGKKIVRANNFAGTRQLDVEVYFIEKRATRQGKHDNLPPAACCRDVYLVTLSPVHPHTTLYHYGILYLTNISVKLVSFVC